MLNVWCDHAASLRGQELQPVLHMSEHNSHHVSTRVIFESLVVAPTSWLRSLPATSKDVYGIARGVKLVTRIVDHLLSMRTDAKAIVLDADDIDASSDRTSTIDGFLREDVPLVLRGCPPEQMTDFDLSQVNERVRTCVAPFKAAVDNAHEEVRPLARKTQSVLVCGTCTGS